MISVSLAYILKEIKPIIYYKYILYTRMSNCLPVHGCGILFFIVGAAMKQGTCALKYHSSGYIIGPSQGWLHMYFLYVMGSDKAGFPDSSAETVSLVPFV